VRVGSVVATDEDEDLSDELLEEAVDGLVLLEFGVVLE